MRYLAQLLMRQFFALNILHCASYSWGDSFWRNGKDLIQHEQIQNLQLGQMPAQVIENLKPSKIEKQYNIEFDNQRYLVLRYSIVSNETTQYIFADRPALNFLYSKPYFVIFDKERQKSLAFGTYAQLKLEKNDSGNLLDSLLQKIAKFDRMEYDTLSDQELANLIISRMKILEFTPKNNLEQEYIEANVDRITKAYEQKTRAAMREEEHENYSKYLDTLAALHLACSRLCSDRSMKVSAPSNAMQELSLAAMIDPNNIKAKYTLGFLYLIYYDNGYSLSPRHLFEDVKARGNSQEKQQITFFIALTYMTEGKLCPALSEISKFPHSTPGYTSAIYLKSKIINKLLGKKWWHPQDFNDEKMAVNLCKDSARIPEEMANINALRNTEAKPP